jgi:SpoVK/Ycf46/Vps4 family AAA+-type ATPase
MNQQLGNAMNMSETTLHLKLFKLISEPDGVQSYMVKIISDMFLKLHINSKQFYDCLLHNNNLDKIIYYGNPDNEKAFLKFKIEIEKKSSKTIVLYKLDSNWSTILKQSIINEALVLKATNDKKDKDALELLETSRKRKHDDDHGPRSFRSKK